MERITDEDAKREEILDAKFEKLKVLAAAHALTKYVCDMIYSYAEFNYNVSVELKENLKIAKGFLVEEFVSFINQSNVNFYFSDSEKGQGDRWRVLNQLVETYKIDEKYLPKNIFLSIDEQDLKDGCFDINYEYFDNVTETELIGTVYYDIRGKIVEIVESCSLEKTDEYHDSETNNQIILGKILQENEKDIPKSFKSNSSDFII